MALIHNKLDTVVQDSPPPEASTLLFSPRVTQAQALFLCVFSSNCFRLLAQVLEIWATYYGAEAGVMGLRCIPTGGLFLAGGMTHKLIHLVQVCLPPTMLPAHVHHHAACIVHDATATPFNNPPGVGGG